jgi:hypothetical protein
VSPETRRRLVGVLGLLSSNHDGERAAAGLLATRILKAAALSWDDLIPEQPLVVRRHEPAYPPSSVGETFKADFSLCRRRLDLLSAWERNFIDSVVHQTSLSEKQKAILHKLFARVRQGAGK